MESEKRIVSGSCMKPSAIIVKPEELQHNLHLDVHFPDGVAQINLKEGKHTAKDLSIRANNLANRYTRLLAEAFNPDEDFLEDPYGFEIYLSLLGLACELCIKSILYREQVSHSVEWERGHDLSKLYSKISEETRQKMEADFALQCPSKSYLEELKRTEVFFMNFRYSYEIDGYSLNLKTAQMIFEILKKHAEQAKQ